MPPQLEIKLDSCPTKKDLLLSISAIFTEATTDPGLLINGNAFFQETTINQDIFAVLTCVWQTRFLLWLSSLIARKVIFLCLLLSFKR